MKIKVHGVPPEKVDEIRRVITDAFRRMMRQILPERTTPLPLAVTAIPRGPDQPRLMFARVCGMPSMLNQHDVKRMLIEECKSTFAGQDGYHGVFVQFV